MSTALLTNQQDITSQRLAESPDRALEDGEARFAVELFALTANNVTYAATGFDIGYWRFYPAPDDGWGITPVWGFASVVETRADAVAVGERFYGFWPMAEQAILKPSRGKSSLRDTSAHRSDLAAVYNTYAPAPASPTDAHRALLQPLIATSWLIADWLADNDYFGAEQIIVGSASSKTGLGLTAFLKDAPVTTVGLTSPGNTGFVETLGYCDQIISYEDVTRIDARPSVYVDMAGNAAVKCALHKHLEGHLKHSSAVGLSHWDQFAPPKDIAGPKPQFFFAPAQIAKRRDDWGPGVIEEKIGQATTQIATDAQRWLTVVNHSGLEAARDPWTKLATGAADPADGHVVIL